MFPASLYDDCWRMVTGEVKKITNLGNIELIFGLNNKGALVFLKASRVNCWVSEASI